MTQASASAFVDSCNIVWSVLWFMNAMQEEVILWCIGPKMDGGTIKKICSSCYYVLNALMSDGCREKETDSYLCDIFGD